MMKVKFLFLYLIFSFACGISQNEPVSTQSAERTPVTISDSTVITKSYVETGGLYDRNYELIIKGTGEVILKNNCKHKKTTEQEQWNVSRDDLASLIESFQKRQFFKLGDKYGETAMDAAIITISIKLDGKEKTVSRWSASKNTSEEKNLEELGHLINSTVDAGSRIRKACYTEDYSIETMP